MFVYDFVYEMVANYLFSTIWASYADASGVITGTSNAFACLCEISREQAYWCPLIATTVSVIAALIVAAIGISILYKIAASDVTPEKEM